MSRHDPLGNNVASRTRAFDGVIDEVRLSDVERTESWIAFQYASMADLLNTFGQLETAP